MPFPKGNIPANKGTPMKEESKLKLGRALKGKIPWNKGKTGSVPWNKGKKTGQKVWNKGTKGIMKAWNKGLNKFIHPSISKMGFKKGEQCINWKGGISTANELQRKSTEMKLWKKHVFERDEYTCQICKEVGGKLHAHHIKSFALFPELRFDINNGITLCIECHKLTDNYGNKKYVTTNC